VQCDQQTQHHYRPDGAAYTAQCDQQTQHHYRPDGAAYTAHAFVLYLLFNAYCTKIPHANFNLEFFYITHNNYFNQFL
jgi:hypothetical protein